MTYKTFSHLSWIPENMDHYKTLVSGKRKPRSNFAIALDSSSSMNSIARETVDAFNGILDSLKSDTHENYVSLTIFSDKAQVKVPLTHIDNFHNLQYRDFSPSGWTALLDAFGLAVGTIDSSHYKDCGNVAIIITDGCENKSVLWNAARVKREIELLEATGSWTVTFQVPFGSKAALCRDFHLSESNVREWEQTAAGMNETRAVTQASLGTYMAARAAGQSAVKNFYANVTVNAPSVKAVKSQLKDVTDRFQTLQVGKEESIKEFVERRSKQPYVIGSAFYQITKKEKIQPNKQVLLFDKKAKRIFGGDEARRLIGLPTDGITHAKIEPGDFGGTYEIFTQSTSVNRALIRGSKVLFDKNMKKGVTPTWDHTKNG